MELNDFSFFAKDMITLSTNEDISKLIEKNQIQVQLYNDNWLLVQGDERILVTCQSSERPLLNNLVLRDQTRWLLTSIQGEKLYLQYCVPVEVIPLDIELGIDHLIADDLYTKQEIRANNLELACEWMSQHFITTHTQDNNWLTIARFSNGANNGLFQLLGRGWRADIERNSENRHIVKRITRSYRQDTAFSLLTGVFSFIDASVAAQLNSATQQAELNAALRDNGSYLELWNLYNDKEWEREIYKAQTLKALRFSASESFEDGRINRWHIIPKSQDAYREFKERWKSLDLPNTTQVDLSSDTPDWTEELSEDRDTIRKQTPRGTIRFGESFLIFTPSYNRRDNTPVLQEGWLYLSLAGQRVMSKRRLAAKNAIDTGKNLPQLKLLLEGISIPTERRRNVKGLTPYAKETFKGGKPTEKQELALERALNTPDLAIIIGPPGTGKTQVIAALQRRLAEENRGQNISGQVLISSFQHDAVDNALDRSTVFNLPGLRIGGKKNSSEEESGFNAWIENQSRHLDIQIVEEYKKCPLLEKIRDLSQALILLRISQYTQTGLINELGNVLEQVQIITNQSQVISSRLEHELEDYYYEQRNKKPVSASIGNHQKTLRCILALRVKPTSFLDDGQMRAWELLRWLERHQHIFSNNDKCLLQQASDVIEPTQSMYEELEQLRNKLLDQYMPDYRPPELKQRIDEQGIGLLNQLEMQLEKNIQQHKQGIAWALEDLANSIKMDRQAALSTLEEYALVVGATCQQAAGNKMASLKTVSGIENVEIVFDTVIIDEAARANPLDLFIPMSMAKRRIILVGDDRQLPHMLEPDIEEQLLEEHELTEQLIAAFRSSLFERLRLKLLAIQTPDNIRVVMLDTQFRMHPVLGDFISRQFYEMIGMDKIKSGRPAEHFLFEQHFLANLGEQRKYYENKVCQWVDIPSSEGPSKKKDNSQSRIREVEAEWIAKEVQRLISAGNDNLSVGIITFYAAQRDLIMEKLAVTYINGIPLMVNKDGNYEPSQNFTRTSNGEERLRVGSVDAFQGKEFDVVVLSCVRTWIPNKTNKNINSTDDHSMSESDKRELQLNTQFGFLRLSNRMNVAMSRQRQMLICVGDAQLATNENAAEGVPALAAFYQLCGGEHGYIRRYR